MSFNALLSVVAENFRALVVVFCKKRHQKFFTRNCVDLYRAYYQIVKFDKLKLIYEKPAKK